MPRSTLARLALAGLLAGAALAAFAPSYTPAATTLGEIVEPDPPTINPAICGGEVAVVQVDSAPGVPPYVVPAGGGVLSSWSTGFDSAATAQRHFLVLRPLGGDSYSVVAVSDPVIAPANGISSFPQRVGVQAGDHLGLYQPSGASDCGIARPGSNMTFQSPPPPMTMPAVGASVTLPSSAPGGQLNLSATLEADGDHDGFGDESQDKCPTDATTQGVCPDRTGPGLTVLVSATQKVKGSLKLVIIVTEQSKVTVSGAVTVPAKRRAKHAAGASAQVALSALTKSVASGAKTTFKLPLPSRVKRSLKRGRKLRTKLTIVATDQAGNATTKSAQLKLKRKRR